jgi:hypothetical protein
VVASVRAKTWFRTVLNSDRGGIRYLHFGYEAQSYLSKGSRLRYRFHLIANGGAIGSNRGHRPSPRAEFPEDRIRILVSNMSEDWLAAVQEAIHETDPRMVEAEIRIAETAIFNRIRDFSPGADALEEQAMLDALGAIRILRSSRRLSR